MDNTIKEHEHVEHIDKEHKGTFKYFIGPLRDGTDKRHLLIAVSASGVRQSANKNVPKTDREIN